ncbi:MAG: acetylglutamate kinase [Chitinophagales bacterium]
MGAKRALIKYGGNAMLNDTLKIEIARKIKKLTESGYQVILVHGGGPFINSSLEEANIQSQFIDGHRVTTKEALRFIERTLKGEVNSDLVKHLNNAGLNSVGLSGKDGQCIIAEKRMHKDSTGNSVDLGSVGNVKKVNTKLPELLLENAYTPVMTCIAADENFDDFNINADMFAGHLAGALKVDYYIVLTDVDGLLKDINRPESILHQISVNQIPELKNEVIKGGMIPKVESCEIALANGAKTAVILNGTKPESIEDYLIKGKNTGTTITAKNI